MSEERGYDPDKDVRYNVSTEVVQKSLRNQRAQLVALEKGWDGYRAPPISASIADELIGDLERGGGNMLVELVPGSGGELQAEWHIQGVVDIEYSIDVDGKRSLYVDRRPLDIGAKSSSTPPREDAGLAAPGAVTLTKDERHELECLRHQHEQRAYPCSPHCSGYLRELASRNTAPAQDVKGLVEALRQIKAACEAFDSSRAILDKVHLLARAALAAFDPNPPAPNKEG